MNLEFLSPDPSERAQHLSAIRSLSEQLHLPADSIAEIYESELSRIRQGALITNYLSILVSRRVSELLRRAQASPPPAADGLKFDH